jgi:hypothetical protein
MFPSQAGAGVQLAFPNCEPMPHQELMEAIQRDKLGARRERIAMRWRKKPVAELEGKGVKRGLG